MTALSFVPAPGRAPLATMVWSHARMETRLLARNGEQVLLALVIPVLLLVGGAESGGVGLALGWHPRAGAGEVLWALLLALTGTAAFASLALLMAGTLRAEATLAGANLVFLLLLVGGGVVVQLDKFPAAAATVLRQLPAGALASGLRDVIQRGGAMPTNDALVLLVWAAAGIAAAGAWFRWE